MRLASLGSGSGGNGTLVIQGNTCLLIDCGFRLPALRNRLARLGLGPSQISAVLVTHEHTDHIAGVMSLAREFQIPVFATEGTATGLLEGTQITADSTKLNWIAPDVPMRIGEIDVLPVSVPHDAAQPVQYLLGAQGQSFGVLTDLGHISSHVAAHFSCCDVLLLEFNHDPALLEAGTYPFQLKRRIAGDLGHLNNRQALDFLAASDLDRLSTLVVGHMSARNNNPQLVTELLSALPTAHRLNIVYACQKHGCDWVS